MFQKLLFFSLALVFLLGNFYDVKASGTPTPASPSATRNIEREAINKIKSQVASRSADKTPVKLSEKQTQITKLLTAFYLRAETAISRHESVMKRLKSRISKAKYPKAELTKINSELEELEKNINKVRTQLETIKELAEAQLVLADNPKVGFELVKKEVRLLHELLRTNQQQILDLIKQLQSS